MTTSAKSDSGAIDVTFLKQGQAGQSIKIASELADFIKAAKTSLHIAIYDFRLKDPKVYQLVTGALIDRANAGVEVKIAFYAGKPASTQGTNEGIIEMDMQDFIATGGDPAPADIGDFLKNPPENIDVKGITGQKLMHNKYVIRDQSAVWTGSTNFTDDAWSFQENNVVQIQSPQLSTFYETDFQALWTKGDIAKTGVGDTGTATVNQIKIEVAFAPGEGETVDRLISELIGSAKHRIKVASMVLTSANILGALNQAIRSNQVSEFNGIYDATQMKQVVSQWSKSGKSDDLISTFKDVANHLVGKHSTPYSPTSKHDFMHNKVVVCDDAIVTGSFNFSRSATQNSENMLILHDKAIADQYATYIDQITAHYQKSANQS